MKLRERKTLLPPIRNSPAKRKKLKIKSSIEGDTSILPYEIIQDILSRLPVESLFRFKCVSKPWYAIISDSKFARIHLLQCQKNLDSGTMFVDHTRFHFLKFTNWNLKLEKLESPINGYVELCSCDGLMLLKSTRSDMFAIWNPSIRTYTRFQSPFDYIVGDWTKRYGLCYDESSDDYKFVLLISNSQYVVYSYKNNSWSDSKDLPQCILPFRASVSGGPGLFVNGSLHWVISKKHENSGTTNLKEYECSSEKTYQLCCFDPKDENFKKISTPVCFDDNYVYGITGLGGELCLYIKTHDFKRLDIWRMNQYGDFNSWTKLLSIEKMPANMGSSFRFVTPMCLTNKSDVVLWIYEKALVVYNPEKNIFREMEAGGDKRRIRKWLRDGRKRLDPLFCLNNSIVLPNRIKN